MSLLEGWPHFRGEFVLKSMLQDFSKWPEYRVGHVSGVLIRGIPLYYHDRFTAFWDSNHFATRMEPDLNMVVT